jgi:hypothetical protein
MSITHSYGAVEFECDACGEVLATGHSDFYDALAQAKDEGWAVRKIKNQWHHFCDADCLKEGTEE